MGEGLIYDGSSVGEGVLRREAALLSVNELNLNNDAKTERFGDQSDRFPPSPAFFSVLLSFTLTVRPAVQERNGDGKFLKMRKAPRGEVRNTKTQPMRGRNFISTVRGQLCEVICRGSPLNLQCL